MNLLTTTQAAARLRLKPRQIQNLISNGVLRADKIGRDWMIHAAGIDEAARNRPKPGRPAGAKRRA